MTTGSSISAALPPLSPQTFVVPSNLISLEQGSDGLTYYVYDSSAVLNGYGVNESEYVTLTLGGGEEESLCIEDNQKAIHEVGTALQTQVQVVPNTTHTKTTNNTVVISNGIMTDHTKLCYPVKDEEVPMLPTFYNDTTVSLSENNASYETFAYEPLTFDEASHFLFHGREECVISTDIPTIETSEASSSSSTTSFTFDKVGMPSSNTSDTTNSSDQHCSSKSVSGKRQCLNEGQTVATKVFKCPYKDCTFWAKRAHRFHEHLCTHDKVRPFGCSSCTYETNWKSDVKKHIDRMIQRNAADHEGAVLTSVSSEKVDISKYKEYTVTLDVPCYMYSGRIGQPSRCSGGNTSKIKKPKPTKTPGDKTETPIANNYNDLLILPAMDSVVNQEDQITTKKKKRRNATRPKPKVKITPLLQEGLSLSSVEANSILQNDIQVPGSNLIATREEVVETTFVPENLTDSDFVRSSNEASQVISETSSVIPAALPTPTFQSKPAPTKQEPPCESFLHTQPHQNSNKPFSKLGESEEWKCTNCTFTHASRTMVLNHLSKFHKLLGDLAKPIQITSHTCVPVVSSSSYLPSSSPPNIIVRGNGDTFNQYFLIVDNSFTGSKSGKMNEVVEQKCDVCPFVTMISNDLIIHKACHGSTDESLTYGCTYCNFKTATRKDMENHHEVHGTTLKVNDYSRSSLKRS